MKLIFRYIVAIIMIPVGVVAGVLGLIQNRLRRDRYEKTYKKIMEEVKTDAQLPQADQQENPGGE